MFRHAVELNWVCRVGNRGWCLLRSEPALSNTDYPRIDPGHQRKPGRGCSQGGPPSSRADQSGAARTDLTTRHCSCDQPFPPDLEPPVRSQSFELLPSPPRQVGVDAAQERVHLKPVEFAIIVHPPANDRVDPLSEFFQVCRGLPVHPPATDLPTLVLQRHRANRRLERREYSAVPARLRLPGTEHIPQERERRVGKLGPPITVLAVYLSWFCRDAIAARRFPSLQTTPPTLHGLDVRSHSAPRRHQQNARTPRSETRVPARN